MEFSDLSQILGGDTYSQMFSDLGFSGPSQTQWGDSFDPSLGWMDNSGFAMNEGGSLNAILPRVSEDATNFINDKGLTFGWEQTGPGLTGTLSAYNPNRTLAGMWKQKDDVGDPLASLALGVALGPLASGLGGAFGGGLTGKIAGGALTGGLGSVVQGGKFGEGLLSGGLGGLVSGFNPAAKLGIENGLIQRGVNSAISGTLSGMARGADFGDALKGAATGAAFNTAGAAMNDLFPSMYKSFMGGNDTSLPALSDNPQMNASYPSDFGNLGNVLRGTQMSFPTPNSDMYQDSSSWLGSIGLPSLSSNPTQNASYGEGYKPPGAGLLEQAGVRGEMSYAPPTANITPDFFQSPSVSSGGGAPDARPLSFSLPSLNQLGSFAANNAGTLAQMLYGMYNNRRQQRLIGDQIAGLRGLYGQNSPYAQQLRARLNAQAAAGGRRSNTGARETQLQAMLADRAASLAPSLAQMQMGQNALRNSNLGIVMGGVRNLKGLGDLFGLGG